MSGVRRGRHTAGGRLAWTPSVRPRHAGTGSARLPLLLATVTGGGLAALALLPSVAAVGEPGPADRVRAQALVPAVVLPERDLPARDRSEAASRSRRVTPAPPEPEPVPVPTRAAPVPSPAAPVLPGCDVRRADLAGYANGLVPRDRLCELPGGSGEQLRPDAALAFVRLAQAYQAAVGEPLCVTDGYRTLAEQRVLRRTKPRLAARPGSSNHGWAVALDLSCGVQSSRTAEHAWLRANAEAFGWELPAWARPGGSRPEPWHWEYRTAD